MPIIPEWIKNDIRNRWERLELKEKFNNIDLKVHFAIAVVICVFLFMVIVVSFLWPNSSPKVIDFEKSWFYDLNTKQLFTEEATKVPPIQAPSGPLPDGSNAGVGAYVYTYVNNPVDGDRIIGFLWKKDPQAYKDNDDIKRWDSDKLVKKPKDLKWVPAISKKGKEIIRKVYKENKKGIRPKICMPR